MLPLLLRRGNEINLELTIEIRFNNHYRSEEKMAEPGWREILGEPLEKGRRIPSAHRAGGRDYRLSAKIIGSRITC